MTDPNEPLPPPEVDAPAPVVEEDDDDPEAFAGEDQPDFWEVEGGR